MNGSFLNNIDGKNAILKQKILGLCINDGDYSIADLSKELGTSIPTITKSVGELIEEGFIEDMGKQGTNGGRRPSIYGLNPYAGYFVGIDVHRNDISIAVTNFKGHTVDIQEDIPFVLENSVTSLKSLCHGVLEHLHKIGIEKDRVRAYGVNLSGRVNNETGYCFTYFIGEDRPIASLLEDELQTPVFVENDSRAMTYGEYICGVANNEKNMLFLNVAWGLGMGMIIDGKLSYGKSGFSGEIGHFPLLDNDQICQCGKTGCLETGASGSALHRMIMEKLREGRSSSLSDKFNANEEISLEDIMAAVEEEDVLAIETVEKVGSTLGRAIAGLINIFNPELVVIGGRVSAAKEYLLLPIKSAIQKHSLNMINKDTTIKFSKLGKKAGPIGACMLSRTKLLGLL
ncbi:MAG: ROK family transcriptional regulator [Bacteroidales bacterium]|nr:ROK family transcriptional regulator [Bacteroidales bacterium]MBQ9722435.1 ROK family transcriptional regulator [Bacteroidales bacterium]